MVDEHRRLTAVLALLLCVPLAACGGSEEEDDIEVSSLGLGFKKDDEGNLYQELDTNKDGDPDVKRVYAEIPDPDDPTVTTMRKLRKFVDVNYDGEFDVIRHYNEEQRLMKEEIDVDFDGKFDTVNFIDDGNLLRKEILNEEGIAFAFRYYDKEEILRIEKDLSGDGKIDYWEYYEGGLLDRIGRDLNGDGRADSWRFMREESDSSGESASAEVPEASADAEGSESSDGE